ncbi:MAG: PAS domain S-box protein [Bacteroidetes bacterium]|nr:PAS domain S-box protein [Bacteroidota bacterium]MBU1717618.1 PAS domain S-box protein [Bacteroidota bacterium]
MKLKAKLYYLVSLVVALFIIVTISYNYIIRESQKSYYSSQFRSNQLVIDNFLSLKTESYLNPVKNNAAWDDMVTFVRKTDTIWAIDNLDILIPTFGYCFINVYDKNKNLIYTSIDSAKLAGKPVILDSRALFEYSDVVSGIEISDGKPFEVFGASIVPAFDIMHLTKPYGYLVTGMLWDEHYLNQIGKATGFDVSFATGQVPDTTRSDSLILYKFMANNDNEQNHYLVFKSKNPFAEKSRINFYVILGLGFFSIIIIIIFVYTLNLWISRPISMIAEGLKGNEGALKGISRQAAEFSEIRGMMERYTEQRQYLLKEIEDRKNAEERLKESVSFADLIYSVVPNAIFTIDMERTIRSWNLRAEQITGYSSDEVIGKDCMFFEEKMACGYSCALFNEEKEKPVTNVICRIKCKDGTYKIVSKNLDVLRDGDGNSILGVESFEDITDRQNALDALRESEQKYSTLVMKLPELIIIHRNGILLYVNDAARQLLGIEPDEMIGRHVNEFIPDEHHSKVSTVIKNRAAGETVTDYELSMIRQDGIKQFFIVKGERITLHGEPAVLNVLLNITERKEAENLIRESEEKFRGISDTAPDSILIVDKNEFVTYTNPASEQLFGIPTAQIMGTPIRKLLEATCETSLRDLFSFEQPDSLKKETPKPVEFIALRKPDEVVAVEITVSHIEIKGELQILAIIRDITSHKAAEEKMRQARDEAEKANRAKSDFLANMSHEIRTPLNGVIGMTELALMTELNDTQKDYVESIRKSAFALLEIINDILDFSKIEAGKFEIENVPFNLIDLIESSVDLFSLRANEKKVELLCFIDPNIVGQFYGDPVRIRQILINLLSNALKFTEKGEILVNVTTTIVDIQPNDPTLIHIAVSDTGVGIEAEKINRIFDSFSQADASISRKYGGTGLGLAISHKLASLMRGSISVESMPGKGSCFTLSVPLLIDHHFQPADNEVDFQGRILVVDDNKTNLDILERMLLEMGLECDSCDSGEAAVDMFVETVSENDPYRIIFMDYMMPGMDGLEAISKIRLLQGDQNQPVIILFSSIDKSRITEQLSAIDIDSFLLKPLKYRELKQTLLGFSSSGIFLETTERTNLVFPDFSDKKILIAEDNDINRKILCEIISKYNCSYKAAINGREALDMYNAEKFDLLILDIHMPEMDGFELTVKIRDIEGAKNHTPIIAISANVVKEDVERFLSGGIDYYISKPFQVQQITEVLSAIFINGKNTGSFSFQRVIADKVLDTDELLERHNFNVQFINEMLTEFKEDFPARIESLKTALQNENLKEARHTAHSIRGVSATLGINRLAILAGKVEDMILNVEPTEKISAVADQIPHEFEEFTLALNVFLGSHGFI